MDMNGLATVNTAARRQAPVQAGIALRVSVLADDTLGCAAIAAAIAARSASVLLATFTEPAALARDMRHGAGSDLLLWYTSCVRLPELELLRKHCDGCCLPLCVVASHIATEAVEALCAYEPGVALLLRSRELTSHQLFLALVQLYGGGSVLTPDVVNAALSGQREDERARLFACLSEEELGVLRLIALGFANREIARRLDCGEKRVDRLATRLLSKLTDEIEDPSVHRRTVAARIYLGLPATVPAVGGSRFQRLPVDTHGRP
jgi:DNA-binding NarL/FixJ family response regulator